MTSSRTVDNGRPSLGRLGLLCRGVVIVLMCDGSSYLSRAKERNRAKEKERRVKEEEKEEEEEKEKEKEEEEEEEDEEIEIFCRNIYFLATRFDGILALEPHTSIVHLFPPQRIVTQPRENLHKS